MLKRREEGVKIKSKGAAEKRGGGYRETLLVCTTLIRRATIDV